MKKTTKIIALMLAVLTVISAFSVSGFAVATGLDAGSSKADAANIPEFGVDYVSSLSTAGEVDWFKFTTLSEDAYYHFYFENYSLANTGSNWSLQSPNLYLYDENMKELNHSYTGNDRTADFSLKLERNTEYYVKILMGSRETDSTGNYQITVSSKLDNASDEMANAKLIELNSNIVSSFDGYGDTDWYCFNTADISGNYNITLVNYDLPNADNWGAESPNLYVYDGNMQELANCYTNNNKTGKIEIELEAEETYYLKIFMGDRQKGAVGNYEFSVTCDGIKSLAGVSVKSMPSKTSYSIGESFDKSGLVVKAEYSDGTSATVTNYTLSGFDSSSEGSNIITVSYTENGVTKSASFTVNIVAQQQEDPEPDPGYQEENDNSDEGDSGDSGFFAMIIEGFMSILDFFMMIIGLLTSFLS